MLRALPSSAWCRRAISAMSAVGLRSMATPRDVELPWHQNLRRCGPSCVTCLCLVVVCMMRLLEQDHIPSVSVQQQAEVADRNPLTLRRREG